MVFGKRNCLCIWAYISRYLPQLLFLGTVTNTVVDGVVNEDDTFNLVIVVIAEQTDGSIPSGNNVENNKSIDIQLPFIHFLFVTLCIFSTLDHPFHQDTQFLLHRDFSPTEFWFLILQLTLKLLSQVRFVPLSLFIICIMYHWIYVLISLLLQRECRLSGSSTWNAIMEYQLVP